MSYTSSPACPDAIRQELRDLYARLAVLDQLISLLEAYGGSAAHTHSHRGGGHGVLAFRPLPRRA